MGLVASICLQLVGTVREGLGEGVIVILVIVQVPGKVCRLLGATMASDQGCGQSCPDSIRQLGKPAQGLGWLYKFAKAI